MPVLHLRVLGSFRAELASGVPLVIATRKAQALLAFLALGQGRPHTRQSLATLLWGETAEKQAQQSFRQALARLRRGIDAGAAAAFVVEGPTVALDPAAVEADAVTLERLVRAGTPEALERACELYRGDLLEGFDFGEPAFDDWLVVERQRVRELAIQALSTLLAHRVTAGAVDAAIDTAARLLAIDPLQESAHRALMRLLVAQGRRGAALRQYQRCVEILRRELRTDPDAETQALYRQIVQEPAAPPAGPETASHLASPPLVSGASLIGRAREMAILGESRERVWRGQSAATVILGEAGVGKSRLMDACAADWRRAGGRVLSGQFYETQQMLPLQGWVDVLHGARLTDDAGLMASFIAEQGGELERLLPALRRGRRRRAGRPDDHMRLFQTVTDLLARIASSQPLLLILDDLQWADTMSLSLLSFVVHRWHGGPLLILGAARDEDLADLSALRVVLDELKRARSLVSLPLLPLDRRETDDLVSAFAGPGVDGANLAALADDVWHVSEGNPFVIVETMRAWEPRRGSCGRPLPRAVRHMVLTRFERLSSGVRDVTATAAVVGREFSFELLRRAAGGDRHDTIASSRSRRGTSGWGGCWRAGSPARRCPKTSIARRFRWTCRGLPWAIRTA
jgi:DNA-binding SARP family transcriptional activator